MLPPRVHRLWKASGFLFLLVSAGVVYLMTMEQLPIRPFWDRLANDATTALGSLPWRELTGGPAQRSASTIPRLFVQGAQGVAGQPLPLRMSLEGSDEGVF